MWRGMIISHRHKFIFFSFPKTGSESVRALLAPYNEVPILPWRDCGVRTPFYPHMPPEEVANAFAAKQWDFEAYRRITCTRNPYPRLVSLYRMICQVDGIWRLGARFGMRPGFERWLAHTRPDGTGGGGRAHQRWRRYGTWSAQRWSRDAGGRNLITDMLQLETANDTLPKLLQDLGLPPAALPRLNHRPATDWAVWFNQRTSGLVAQRYAWDMENLNYSAPLIRR